MKKLHLLNVMVVGSAFMLLVSCNSRKASENPGFPEGWLIAGNQHECYDIGTDHTNRFDSLVSGTIRSREEVENGFATLMQMCSPVKYLGKRIRMSGYLRTSRLKEWSGLWLRVDVDSTFVAFDNMHDGDIDRSVKGDTDWKKYDIVVNVPENASRLAYGALLSGEGQIWFDRITFEEVDNTVPLTGITRENSFGMPAKSYGGMQPFNLSFEH